MPNKELNLGEKEEFIQKLFAHKELRKNVLGIIKRKGLMHSYRWPTWKLLQNYSKNCMVDRQLIEKRKQIYKLLLKTENKEVMTIVNKDVVRTAR